MPLVRISLRQGTTPEYRTAIADAVQQALVEAIAIPAGDRFQVISQYAPGDLIYDSGYLNIRRTDSVVFIQITLSAGRKPAQKRALFKRIAELVEKSPGIRQEDVIVNLIETTWENWSFGNGEAQYQLD